MPLDVGQRSPWQRSHLAFSPGIRPCDFMVESSLSGREGLPGEEEAGEEAPRTERGSQERERLPGQRERL